MELAYGFIVSYGSRPLLVGTALNTMKSSYYKILPALLSLLIVESSSALSSNYVMRRSDLFCWAGWDMRGGSGILNVIEVQPTESDRIDLSISPNKLD